MKKDHFTARVLAVVRRIPYGRVATYGEVAALAGRPRAARAVGNIMRTCGRPDVPCHRVVAAGGRLGGYGGNEAIKRALLLSEGVIIHGRRIHMAGPSTPLRAGPSTPLRAGPSTPLRAGPSMPLRAGNARKGRSRLRD